MWTKIEYEIECIWNAGKTTGLCGKKNLRYCTVHDDGRAVCLCPFRRCTGDGIIACRADGRSSLVVVEAAMAWWGGSKCVRATCVFIILYLLTSLTCCRWRRQWWYSLVNVLRVKHLLFFSSSAAERRLSLLRVLPSPSLSSLQPLTPSPSTSFCRCRRHRMRISLSHFAVAAAATRVLMVETGTDHILLLYAGARASQHV